MNGDQRQRWRIVVARGEAARDLLHRDVTTAWEAGLVASGLPLSMTGSADPRPRFAFAAPAALGMLGERELMDLVLSESLRIHEVRPAIERAAPAGYRLVDLYDVWLGSPTLAALVVAGDYRATVNEAPGESAADGSGAEAATARRAVEPAEAEAVVAGLLAATTIQRARSKGGGTVAVDIRPQVRALRVIPVGEPGADPGVGTFGLWMRLLLGGEGGVGRPEEVVAALGDRLGRRLVTGVLTRERIVLADDPDA